MVRSPSLSKQIATASNDSMVFVWNLNQAGNIYKYIGHRVRLLSFRMLSLMSNSHLLATNLLVAPKIRLSRFGPIMQKEILSQSKLITHPFGLWITAMMGNFF